MEIFTKFKTAFITFMQGKTAKKILEGLTEEQKKLGSRIFNLVTGRVLKAAYLSLAEGDKKKMEEIFLSDDEQAQENFLKEYVPNFKGIFEDEAEKLEEEIKAEIEKQV